MSTVAFQSVPPSVEGQEAAQAAALKLAEGLFPHQIEGVAFLLARRRAILADDMGLGKTRQAIVSLRHVEPSGPYLVVCPASVKWNWEREIRRVDAAVEVRIVNGGGIGEKGWRGFGGWVVINYDILGKNIEALLSCKWKGIIFDEAHYLKNRESKRSKVAGRLALKEGADPVVYALTGTPLTNRPRDLFSLLQLVRHPLGKSFLSFAKRYCAAEHNGYGWVTTGASNLEELTLQLQGITVRRRKEQVLCLPPKVRSWLPVEVPEGTASAELREVVATLLRGQLRRAAAPGQKDGLELEQGDRARLLAKLTKARQKLAVSKASSSIELAEGAVEQGEKVIVFSCFDQPLKAIKKHFDEACVLLTGATPASQRQELVDKFQGDDGVRVFAANIVAGGIGLNLTAARQVVFNDLDWVPANHWQAEDRAYRIGQKGAVNVHYLVALGTVDEFVQNVLKVKAALVEAVVEGKALSPLATRDVLSELAEWVGRISPRLADVAPEDVDEDWVKKLLREVSQEVELEARAAGNGQAPGLPLAEEAIATLARVLAGAGRGRVFRAASNSEPGKSYSLEFDGIDVLCSCPGFEFRGTCSHARKLKEALARGQRLPAGYEEVAGGGESDGET
jgi:SWI/SNF-related matrix-associated actin-dependent regulator 1 of chromatin subfamily A